MNTIKDEVQNELVINKSTFICLICSKKSIKEARDYVEQVKARYPDATHHPDAYIIGNSGEYGHASDDGEPSRTAGAPMYDVLRKNNLTNVVAVVVRYFGGIKLGAGGLVRAYAKSVAEALKLATLVPIIEYRRLRLVFDYPFLTLVENMVGETNIINRSFSGNITLDVEIPTKDVLLYKSTLTSLTQGNILISEYKPEEPDFTED
jgi:uncharacterized YigZ family protein